MKRFHAEVRRALLAAGVTPGARLVCACSHGPDSLALADALAELVRPLRLGALTLCYVDHGLRAASAGEAAAVRAFAATRGVAVDVRRVTVESGRGLGPEEAARHARHAALTEAAAAARADWIVLGHTASDQAETVLMRLVRGAGPVGLAGIPARRGRLVRPLLGIPRAQVLAYLAARGLVASHDASNDDPRFTRNRVRHTLLPALAAENPRVEQALTRAAAALAEQAAALDWAAGRAAPELGLERAPGWCSLDAAALSALPAAVAKRALAHAATGLGVSLAAAHLDALLRLRAGGHLALPRLTASHAAGRLALTRTDTDRPAARIRVLVQVEGPGGPFRARFFRAGDRMRPLRLAGRSRKLSDLYADARVARAARTHSVIVENQQGEIVWAEHIGCAAGSRTTVALTRMDPGVTTDLHASQRPKR